MNEGGREGGREGGGKKDEGVRDCISTTVALLDEPSSGVIAWSLVNHCLGPTLAE